MKPKTIEEIVEEIAPKITDLTGYGQALHPNDIKPDIREALSTLIGQEIAWVEGRKKMTPSEIDVGSEMSTPRIIRSNGYNQACDDIIEHLRELLK